MNYTQRIVSVICCILTAIPFIQPQGAQASTCPLPIKRPVRSRAASTVYYITEDCMKRPVFNPDVYFSHFSSWTDVRFVEERVLSQIPDHPLRFLPWGSRRQFLGGSLLKTTDDPKVYLKIGDGRHPLASEQAFYALGFRFDQVEDVVPEVLDAMPLRGAISGYETLPIGLFVKAPSAPEVYRMENVDGEAIRRHISRWSSSLSYREDRLSILPADVLQNFRVLEDASQNEEVDAGTIPFAINWPTAPVTTDTVTVRDASAFNAAAAVPGTRITVNASFGGSLSVSASDVAVEVSSGVRLGDLTIRRGVKRISISGGEFSRIHVESPTVYWPAVYTDPNLFVEDVRIDGVRVVTPRSGSEYPIIAIELQGRRIAVVNSETSAWSYSIWSGANASLPSEDIIIANNVFASDGPEATVRLVNVRRTAVTDNRLTNGRPEVDTKHNFRIHGRSEDAYVARNTLVYSGTMIGTMDGDSVSRVWFHDNTLHQLRPDAFNMDRTRIAWLSAVNNRLYSDRHDCFLCGAVPSGWTSSGNTVSAYRAP